MKKLAVGMLPVSLGAIVPAHAILDTEVEALIFHNAGAAATQFEVWLMGARVLKMYIQPAQTINVLKYIGIESVTFPPGDNIEANTLPPGTQVNYVALGCRFKAAA